MVDGKIRRRSTLMAPAQHAHFHGARGVVSEVVDGVALPLGRLNTSNFSKLIVSNGMDAPTYTASKCAKVEMQINHLNRQERPT